MKSNTSLPFWMQLILWVPMSRAEQARGESVASAMAAAVAAWFALISAIDVSIGHHRFLLTAVAATIGALWWATFAWRWRRVQARVERLEIRAENVFFQGLPALAMPVALVQRAASTLTVLVLLSSATRLWTTETALSAAPATVLALSALVVTAFNLFMHRRTYSLFDRGTRVVLSIERRAPEARTLRCTLHFAERAVDGRYRASIVLFPLFPEDQPFERSIAPVSASLREVRRSSDSRTFDVTIDPNVTAPNRLPLHRRATLNIAADGEPEWLFVLDRSLGSIVEAP